MATKRGSRVRAAGKGDNSIRPESAPTRAATASGKSLAAPARPVIEHVRPQVDCGRRPAKATVGDLLGVEADIFVDGHEWLYCEVRYRHDGDAAWSTVAMRATGNDHWRAEIPISALGHYRFLVRAKVNYFATWRHDLRARAEAGQELGNELVIGAELIEGVQKKVRGSDRAVLSLLVAALRSGPDALGRELSAPATEWAGVEQLGPTRANVADLVFSDRLNRLMGERSDGGPMTSSRSFDLTVDSGKARFSTWYEMFPRSAGSGGRHGTFADVREKLDYVSQMGFDVLYLPPIHPIGRSGRKGRDGAMSATPDEPGSPWAIGGLEGGHSAIHSSLGSLDEFRALVADAAARGIDIALDVAFQASPDHPWVSEHPEWFRHLPDGSIRHAENPPKKYEDIYPLNFDTADWQAMWAELLGVVRYWIAQGIKVFRVDNPHTKPFAFWEWLLATIHFEAPEVIFLSEAFTRPRVMEQLAKIGFSQSYTYFTWRTSKWELESYFNELVHSDVADYFRPNLWPNTPDILSAELQSGGRAAFLSRLVLAATLGSSYGIYGPAFELQEHLARSAGSEEYARSEKYEVRSWNLRSRDSLAGFIGLVNKIRREHPALQFNDALKFHSVDNNEIICYSKTRQAPSGPDVVVVAVNLDHSYSQAGWVDLDLASLGVDYSRPYVMHDLLTDARYTWNGSRNYVRLDPAGVPCHVFSLQQPDAGRSPGDSDDR
ncbi:MAG: alpha-1,4-glucan--maltose-1-phosphate maltosyltransferase [Acidimicrobiales bacterium]|jgi:starch synthase (maltosyl-transferring)